MRYKTANEIINQVAVEVGLQKTGNAFSSEDQSFEQLAALASTCGNELLEEFNWGIVTREHVITTKDIDNGKYPLPDDFKWVVNQTAWDLDNKNPIPAVSPQEWSAMAADGLLSETLYISLRQTEGQLWLYPYAAGTPSPQGRKIKFEYVSNNWVKVNGIDGQYAEHVANSGDVILFPYFMFERLLKMRFLEAKGFDSTAAAQQYALSVQKWEGRDNPSPVLSMASNGKRTRLLDVCNLPDTGYGI